MGIAEDFRKEAAEQREAATLLVSADDLATNPKKQIAAVVGLVDANQLDALARLAESIGGADVLSDPRMELRRRAIAKNQAVRLAAVKGQNSGDWSDFDKLIADESARATAAANAAESG